MSRCKNPRLRGSVMIYTIIAMLCLMGFTSLAVDFGRVQVSKTELERAAIAAARYGAKGVSDSTAVAKAIQSASDNLVNGTPLVLQNADVTVGTWASNSFTAGGSAPNAIQVKAYRTKARGTAIPLLFAQIIGQSTCDLSTTAVAIVNSSPTTLTGLNSIAMHSNLFVSSYDSSVTTNPSHSSYTSNGVMQSNGAIGTGATTGNKLYGGATLGPSGSISGITCSTASTTLSSAIATPTVTMQVVSNPYGVPSNYDVSSSVTAPAGTYYMTALTIENGVAITFTGPATIYMDGNLTIGANCSMIAYNNIPSNLTIYQSSGHTMTMQNSNTFVGVLDAPGSALTMQDSDVWEGSIFAKSVTFHDNDSVYLDKQLAGAGNGSITLVK